MAVIGSIAVNILARTSKFESGIKRTRKQLKGLDTEVRGLNLSLAKMTKVAGAAFAGIASVKTVNMLRNTANEIDHIAKTSDKLGIATENLIGLRHAAKLTGVETNTLEMALQRLTRRVSEAAQGKGEAKDALKELRLEAASLNAMSPDQMFAKIADRMNLVANEGDRVRLAFKLFDSEGVSLVNTLKLGSQGLADLNKEAEALGVTFSRSEAAKIEKYNDALERLSKILTGMKQKAVIGIANRLDAAGVNPSRKTPDKRDFLQRASDFSKSMFGDMHFMEGTGDAIAVHLLKRLKGPLDDLSVTLFGRKIRGRTATGKGPLELGKATIGSEDELGLNPGFIDDRYGLAKANTTHVKRRESKMTQFLQRAIVDGFKDGASSVSRAAVGFAGLSQQGRDQARNAVFQRMFHNLISPTPSRRQAMEPQPEASRVISSRVHRSSGSRALEANTSEGFAAVRRNLSPQFTLQKEQLVEAKKQTKQLDKIANANKPQIVTRIIPN